MENAEFKTEPLGDVRLKEICPGSSNLDPSPNEVQIATEKEDQAAAIEAGLACTEKLMPCGMRYPEPFRVRPNFFIPLLAVSSYVMPFFMLIFVGQNLHNLPFISEFSRYLYKHLYKIYIPEGLPISILVFFMTMLPMLVGGLLAYTLSKNSKLNFKQKLLLWFAPVFLLVTLEIFSPTFITSREPNPARPINSAH